jgi:hypothetical protein
LLAALVWVAAYEVQSLWSRLTVIGWEGFPPQTAMVVAVFAVAVWIGLRALMGLYPGVRSELGGEASPAHILRGRRRRREMDIH